MLVDIVIDIYYVNVAVDGTGLTI